MEVDPGDSPVCKLGGGEVKRVLCRAAVELHVLVTCASLRARAAGASGIPTPVSIEALNSLRAVIDFEAG
eukprot:7616305-Pyramimonas_sp.AAC.1